MSVYVDVYGARERFDPHRGVASFIELSITESLRECCRECILYSLYRRFRGKSGIDDQFGLTVIST